MSKIDLAALGASRQRNGSAAIRTSGGSATLYSKAKVTLLPIALLACIGAVTATAQGPGGTSGTSSAADAATVSAGQQQLYNATGQNGASVSNDTFKGSIVAGKSTGTVIDLPLSDAIQRGLKQNLGILLNNQAASSADGSRLEQLQPLLPTVTAQASIEVEQLDLAAFGLKFPGFNPIVGPFQVEDFRAFLTQRVVDINALQTYIASKHNFRGAQLTAEDARQMVVLTVGNAYLVCVADAARIEAVNAAVKTAKLTYDQAVAAHDAGTSPRLDVLRAQVDYQSEQQTLISATNQLAKDKLVLARAIGLPLDQEYNLTDRAPFRALDNPDPGVAFDQALHNRKDLAAAREQVEASKSSLQAAKADKYPTAKINGDFGDIGTTVGHSHGTYTATGTIEAPVLQVVRDKGEQEVAGAALEQNQARLSDKEQQVNADIRSSILDIQTAAKLVDAAKSNVDLATEALSEAQERFHAGVADSLPVSQAQTQFEQANDQYISALYQHNVAKLTLARALGIADTRYQDYLGGK
jgi:outer membrane protein TolC